MSDWGFRGLSKYEGNPILSPRGSGWESRAVFNPAAWTDGETVYLLYRAEGPSNFSVKGFASRIGLATSTDGINFERLEQPVLEPREPYEFPGGCEDPRLIRVGKSFVMTYTGYDGSVARLAMAQSHDLHAWRKLGPTFSDEKWDIVFTNKQYSNGLPRGWSKSGAILAEPIDGQYWMFFGDTHIWAATSRNLKDWAIIKEPVLSPRPGCFDSRLIEPGPPPVLLPEGIWLGYNCADDELSYSFGQCLLDRRDPLKTIERGDTPLLLPATPHEVQGQVPRVVFGEAMIFFRGRWTLYYGMGDSHVGMAYAEPNKGSGFSTPAVVSA